MKTISVRASISEKPYVLLPFYRDGVPLEQGARWGMTVRKAGSMRFRWNETNPLREQTLGALCGKKQPVSLELIHSKIVYTLSCADDTRGKTGDGMITQNAALVPVVTVADCVPLFLYDPKTNVFGVCHSGWKGTGIIGEAIACAVSQYGVRVADICVAIGPHIHDCCYAVDEARASYFSEQFTPDCVTQTTDADGTTRYQLSLLKANLSVLARAGIRSEHIVVADDCTSCAQDARGDYPFGSFRRQAAFISGLTADERSRAMTVQAAFCGLWQ